MNKLITGAALTIAFVGCSHDPADDATACRNNMIFVQGAVEEWCEKHDYYTMPTMKQLAEEKCLNAELRCPTDNSEYTWSYNEARIQVVCPHADKGHKIR